MLTAINLLMSLPGHLADIIGRGILVHIYRRCRDRVMSGMPADIIGRECWSGISYTLYLRLFHAVFLDFTVEGAFGDIEFGSCSLATATIALKCATYGLALGILERGR